MVMYLLNLRGESRVPMTVRAMLRIWVGSPKILNPKQSNTAFKAARPEPLPCTSKQSEPKPKHFGSKDARPHSPSPSRGETKERKSKKSKKSKKHKCSSRSRSPDGSRHSRSHRTFTFLHRYDQPVCNSPQVDQSVLKPLLLQWQDLSFIYY